MEKMNEEDYTISTGKIKINVEKINNNNRIEGWYWCRIEDEWGPYYYDPEEGFIECADAGMYIEDSDFDEIDERIAEPLKMSEIQISNIYKNMDDLIKSKNDRNSEIVKIQAEDILCQMLIGLGHKELVINYNKLF